MLAANFCNIALETPSMLNSPPLRTACFDNVCPNDSSRYDHVLRGFAGEAAIEAFLVQLVELRLVLLKQQDVLVEGTLHVHLNAGSGTTAEGIHQRAQFTIHGSRLTVPSRVGGRVSLCALLLHLVEVAMQEFVLVRLLLPGVLEPFLGLSQEVLQGVGCHLL